MAAIDLAPKRQRRIFHGWYIAVVSLIATFAGSWASLFSLGVMLKPMSLELGWSRATIVGAAAVGGIVSGLTSPLIGRFIDREGVKLVMVLSGIVGGLALAATYFVQELWVYYLVFGVLFGLTRPGQQLGPAAALANWFIRKRARVMALATVGVPIAGIIGVPITQSFINAFGWRGAWVFLGACFVLLVTVPSLLWLKRRPEDMGLHPDGEPLPPVETAGGVQTVARPRFWIGPARLVVDWEAKEAIRTKAFWLLIVAGDLMTIAAPSMALHMTPYFSDMGLPATAAAFAATSFGVGTFVARVFWGFVAEHMHIQYCFVAIAFVGFLGMIGMLVFNSVPWAYFAAAFTGLSGGGMFQLQMQIWPDYFGRKFIGTIRGYSTPFQTLAITLGPLFVAWAYDLTKGYTLAFVTFAITSALGSIIMLFNSPPVPPKMRPAGEALAGARTSG